MEAPLSAFIANSEALAARDNVRAFLMLAMNVPFY